LIPSVIHHAVVQQTLATEMSHRQIKVMLQVANNTSKRQKKHHTFISGMLAVQYCSLNGNSTCLFKYLEALAVSQHILYVSQNSF